MVLKMSSSKNKEKNIIEKIKEQFGIQRSTSSPLPSDLIDSSNTREFINSVRSVTNNNNALRLKNLQEFTTALLNEKRLENHAFEAIWPHISDLWTNTDEKYCKETVFDFLKVFIETQFDSLGIVRAKLLRIILDADNMQKFVLLNALTAEGKDISYFEEEIGDLLISLLQASRIECELSESMLAFISSILKFNSAYLDAPIIDQIIEFTSNLILTSRQADIKKIHLSLDVFDSVIAYSYLSKLSVIKVASSLCYIVNASNLTHSALKTILKLAGTHSGVTLIRTLCDIIDQGTKHSMKNSCQQTFSVIIRGAIFFISVCLWSFRKISTLKFTLSCILPYFKNIMVLHDPFINFEICSSISLIISSCSYQEVYISCELIFKILTEVCTFLGHNEENNFLNQNNIYFRILNSLNTVLFKLEEIVKMNMFTEFACIFYNLVDNLKELRPKRLSVSLVLYKASILKPSQYEWLSRLKSFIEEHFLLCDNDEICLLTLRLLKNIYSKFRLSYEHEILDKVFNTSFASAPREERSVKIVVELIDLIGYICLNTTYLSFFTFYVSLLQQIANKTVSDVITHIDSPTHDPNGLQPKIMCIDALFATLQRIFLQKITEYPASSALEVFSIIFELINSIYQIPKFLIQLNTENRKAFLLGLTTLRSASLYYGGLVAIVQYENISLSMENKECKAHESLKTPELKYNITYFLNSSTFKTMQYSAQPNNDNVSTQFKTSNSDDSSLPYVLFPSEVVVKVFTACLKFELDWSILSLFVSKLGDCLKDKALFEDVSVETMCDLVDSLSTLLDKSRIEAIKRANNTNISRSYYSPHIFSIYAILFSYNKQISKNHLAKVIISLETSLFSKCVKEAILALSLALVEIPDILSKFLSGILIDLSKMSPINTLSMTILEFLSILSYCPALYTNFIQDQYMSIFAIALPFTNPFKYDDFIVFFAHQVIAAWFINCRLKFRKNFVKFIIKGLKANILYPFRDRCLSSSLNDYEDDDKGEHINFNFKLNDRYKHKTILVNHLELFETCEDMLEKYTFAEFTHHKNSIPSSNIRSLCPGSNIKSQTWLVANKLITISALYANTTEISDKSSIRTEEDLLSKVCNYTDGAEYNYETDDLDNVNNCNLESNAGNRKNSSSKKFSKKGSSDSATSSDVSDQPSFSYGVDRFKRTQQQEALYFSDWKYNWVEIYIRKPTGNMYCLLNGNIDDGKSDNSIWKSIFDIASINVFEKMSDFKKIRNEFKINPFSANYVKNIQTFNQFSMISRFKSLNYKQFLALFSCSSIDYESHLNLIAGTILSSERETNSTRMYHSLPSILKALNQESQMMLSRLPSKKYSKKRATFSFSRKSRTTSMPENKDALKKSSLCENAMTKHFHSKFISPSSVFLQLFTSIGNNVSEEDRPILLQESKENERAIKCLDYIHPFETHKIGILYVGKGQASSELEILSNERGSLRYTNFLHGIGQRVLLSEAHKLTHNCYLGGLDTSGNDGEYTFIWKEAFIQTVFHVITLMPNKPSDTQFNSKKCHIGNDFVHIVYNDDDESCEYAHGVIKCQFSFVSIVIHPIHGESNVVSVKCLPELKDYIGSLLMRRIISDQNLSFFVRLLAVHINLACKVYKCKIISSSDQTYASHWLERLRQIKRIKARCLLSQSSNPSDRNQPQYYFYPKTVDKFLDFTEFS